MNVPVNIKETEIRKSPMIVKKKSVQSPLCAATEVPPKIKMEKNIE